MTHNIVVYVLRMPGYILFLVSYNTKYSLLKIQKQILLDTLKKSRSAPIYQIKPSKISARARPGYGQDWHHFLNSFKAAAFAVATILASKNNNLLWKGFMYGSAALAGTARVYHRMHWLSDVAFGALIGYSISRTILSSEGKGGALTAKWQFAPQTVSGYPGLGIRYLFP